MEALSQENALLCLPAPSWLGTPATSLFASSSFLLFLFIGKTVAAQTATFRVSLPFLVLGVDENEKGFWGKEQTPPPPPSC